MNAPFQYETLATKEYFVDRVEDRTQLKNFLSSYINVMLVSLQRWGKSSLVKVVMGELQEKSNKCKKKDLPMECCPSQDGKVLLSSSLGVPLVLLLSPYGASEMARNGFEDDLKWYAL